MLLPFFWPSQIPSFIMKDGICDDERWDLRRPKKGMITMSREICFALFLKWGVIWGGTRDNRAKKGW
jgi:hypothetical protein